MDPNYCNNFFSLKAAELLPGTVYTVKPEVISVPVEEDVMFWGSMRPFPCLENIDSYVTDANAFSGCPSNCLSVGPSHHYVQMPATLFVPWMEGLNVVRNEALEEA